MKVGIDFDNTIVDYDAAFYACALERGLIPAELAADKVSVKRHLVDREDEDEWTKLQGYVYGPGIEHATPYEGVVEFFTEARGAGISLVIISHKTRRPYLGPGYDLHASALSWIRRIGLDEWVDGVFLETTREEKLGRIGSVGCEVFVDDLPDILGHPMFPATTRPVWFAPRDHGAACPENATRLRAWSQIWGLLGVARSTGQEKGAPS